MPSASQYRKLLTTMPEATALAQAYEALRIKLYEQLPPAPGHEEDEDDPAAAAIQGWLTWWLWGN